MVAEAVTRYKCTTYRVFVTKTLIFLPIALGNRDSTIVVHVPKQIVRHVSHSSQSSATVEQRLEAGFDAGPHLDPGSVAGVCEGYVVDVEVFDDVGLVCILP